MIREECCFPTANGYSLILQLVCASRAHYHHTAHVRRKIIFSPMRYIRLLHLTDKVSPCVEKFISAPFCTALHSFIDFSNRIAGEGGEVGYAVRHVPSISRETHV